MLLKTVRQTQKRTGQSVGEILEQLTLPSATYYRWQGRQQAGDLADQVARSRPKAPLPTPKEVTAVRHFALAHPKMGYRRLTWQMVDEDMAYLRPYRVYRVLKEPDLLHW